MDKVYMSRAQTRAMASEMPIGDPFGGVAYGEKNDPVTATIAAGSMALGGGLLSAKASKNAANLQAQSANQANMLQGQQFELTRQDNAPWREAGMQGLGSLRDMLQPGGDLMSQFQYQNEPGYQFGLDEGMKGLLRTLPRAYGFDSGATLKALQRYGTDYASTKYNEAFNRDQAQKAQKYNFLAGLSGLGQTATAQTQAAGTNYANNVSNNMMSGGAARAAGLVGSSNALGGALSNLGNMGLQYSFMNRYGPQTGGGGGNAAAVSPGYYGNPFAMSYGAR